MISYDLCSTPKDNYISIMISDDKRLISVSSYSLTVRVIDKIGDKDTKYIEISPDRFNKLVQKVTRKILCTVQ